MQESVKERLLAAKKAAAEQMELIRSQENLALPFLRERLRQYILFKLLLDEESCPSDDLGEIVTASLERSLRLDKSLVQMEKGGGCDGAPPSITRKLLLFLAIQQELGIKLSPQELALVKTTAELYVLVLKAIQAGKPPAD